MAPPAPSVLLLSALVGRAVHVDGRPVGRVVDLVVDLADEDGAGEPIALPRIVAAVVQEGRRAAERSVPWGAVDRVEPEALVLLPRDEAATSPVEPGEQQLRLGRDVLDAQVFVFEGGGRMARVSDVLLAAEGQRGELQVVGVDVGFGAVCRRLGLHRLADRFGDEVIGWHQIHLASRSGHRVALLASRSSVHRVDAAQLAPLIDALASDPATALQQQGVHIETGGNTQLHDTEVQGVRVVNQCVYRVGAFSVHRERGLGTRVHDHKARTLGKHVGHVVA